VTDEFYEREEPRPQARETHDVEDAGIPLLPWTDRRPHNARVSLEVAGLPGVHLYHSETTDWQRGLSPFSVVAVRGDQRVRVRMPVVLREGAGGEGGHARTVAVNARVAGEIARGVFAQLEAVDAVYVDRQRLRRRTVRGVAHTVLPGLADWKTGRRAQRMVLLSTIPAAQEQIVHYRSASQPIGI
jgi:hypothetical protein